MPSAVIRLGVEGAQDVKDALKGVQRDAESLERHFASKLEKSLAQSGAAAAEGLKPLGGQMGNVVAQLNDIGVSLASGQSPFTVMLQQGSQLSGVLGDRGLKGALSAMGQGLVSMLNPVNALFLGMGALATAGIYAFNTLSGAGRTFDDVLKDSNERLKESTKLLADYGVKLEQIALKTPSVTSFQQQQSVEEIRKTLEKEIEGLLSGVAGTQFKKLRSGFIGSYVTAGIKDEFKPFSDLFEQLKRGEITLAQLNEGVSQIGQKGGPEVAKAASAVLDMAAAATKASQELTGAEVAMAALVRTGLAGMSPLEDKLNTMTDQFFRMKQGITRGIELEDPTANRRVEDAFGSFEFRNTSRDKASAGGQVLTRETNAIQDKIDSLKAEAQTWGMVELAAQRYKMVQDAIDDVRRAGKTLSDDQILALNRQGDAWLALAEKQRAWAEQQASIKDASQQVASTISSGLKGVIMNFDDASEALKRFGLSFAEMLLNISFKPIEALISSQLTAALTSSLGTTNVGAGAVPGAGIGTAATAIPVAATALPAVAAVLRAGTTSVPSIPAPWQYQERFNDTFDQFQPSGGVDPRWLDAGELDDALAGVTNTSNDLSLSLARSTSATDGFSSGLSSVFSGAGNIISQIFGTSSAMVPGGWYHEGGMVPGGRPGLFPASLFQFAPRLHGGLGSDEYPAILQRGERVQSRGEVARGSGAVRERVVEKTVVVSESPLLRVAVRGVAQQETASAMRQSQRERDRRG